MQSFTVFIKCYITWDNDWVTYCPNILQSLVHTVLETPKNEVRIGSQVTPQSECIMNAILQYYKSSCLELRTQFTYASLKLHYELFLIIFV